MAVLSFLSLAETLKTPGGIPWEWLIVKVFDFVVNYGWRIVLFTVLLKVVLLPLDIYQKHCMRKNQRITERLKPEMEKLQKAYGHDKQAFAQKQMELNKREGFSYFSSSRASSSTESALSGTSRTGLPSLISKRALYTC